MKINRLDSKKFFVESVLSALPKEYRNKAIVKKTLLILQSIFAPGKNEKTPAFKKYNLTQKAWEELAATLKGKERLNANETAYVKFIEQEIFRYACYKIKTMDYSKYDGAYDEGEELLSSLRAGSTKGVDNTCCYLCRAVLERRNADEEFNQKHPHYCTRIENLNCYYKRKTLETKQNKEIGLFIDKAHKLKKPYCVECGKLVTYFLQKRNYFYKGLPFCHQKHKEVYRKREFRKHNKLREFTSKTS